MIRGAFNEFKENRFALITSTFLFAINVALVSSLKFNGTAKIFQWICNLLSSNTLLWSTLGKPIYGYLFRRESYLAEFKQGLKEEGLSPTTSKASFINKNKSLTSKLEKSTISKGSKKGSPTHVKVASSFEGGSPIILRGASSKSL